MSLLTAELTLLDGTKIQVPIDNIASYRNRSDAYGQGGLVQTNDNRQIPVQESESYISTAIYNAIDRHP